MRDLILDLYALAVAAMPQLDFVLRRSGRGDVLYRNLFPDRLDPFQAVHRASFFRAAVERISDDQLNPSLLRRET